LCSEDRVLHIPDTFLNGSAPSLRNLYLVEISFPSLPRLLPSASHLTSLILWWTPNSVYILPESLATSLSASTNLQHLGIELQPPTPHLRRRDRPLIPPNRIVLPALTELLYHGVSEYLEDFASQIDAPLLHHIDITLCNQLIFYNPQISRLILSQMSSMPEHGILEFGPNHHAAIDVNRGQEDLVYLRWTILCEGLDWQVDSIAQICTHLLPLCSSVDSLDVLWSSYDPLGVRLDELDPTQWIELFSSFTSVQELVIPGELELFIAAALEGLTEESAAEVLPALRSLSICGTTTDRVVEQGIQSFVAARQHSDHPVDVTRSLAPRRPSL
jgi:hypothetical protein